jgi:hypothetical protein
MQQAFNDTNEIMTMYTNIINLYKEKPISDIKPRGYDFKLFEWNVELREIPLNTE